jgi:hypothetical protein
MLRVTARLLAHTGSLPPRLSCMPLQYPLRFGCAQAKSEVFMDRGSLQLRNSETLEVQLYRVEPESMEVAPVSVQISPQATLRDLSLAIEAELPIKDMKVLPPPPSSTARRTSPFRTSLPSNAS